MRDLSIARPTPDPAFDEELASGEAHLTRRQLTALVKRIGDEETWWRPMVRHDFDHRWYARLHWSPRVEVWLLGWQPGQDTNIHDHGGSSGAFVVTEGTLTERYGSAESGTDRDRRHRPGRPCSFGPSYVHNLGNGGPGVATSVHAYAPPLSTMTYYRSDGGGLIPYETMVTSGPEPGIDLDQATGVEGYAAPFPP